MGVRMIYLSNFLFETLLKLDTLFWLIHFIFTASNTAQINVWNVFISAESLTFCRCGQIQWSKLIELRLFSIEYLIPGGKLPEMTW